MPDIPPTVDESDVNDAAAYWRRHAPAKYRTILDAKEHGE